MGAGEPDAEPLVMGAAYRPADTALGRELTGTWTSSPAGGTNRGRRVVACHETAGAVPDSR
ncbi:hypothetical protein GCM10027294_15870 [Marinactinospora endophytica]